jgi:STE24 endopeptidase
MQIVVFAAFAIVMSIPDGPPHAWIYIHTPLAIWVAVVAQVLLATLAGAVTTYRVKSKLDQDPAWLPAAQRRFNKGNTNVRAVLMAGFVACIFLTGWVDMVRSWRCVGPVWGLDELLILSPFLLAILTSYVALYPADRAIRRVALELQLWASVPTRPPWSLRAFLKFMFRQNVLIVAVPMLPVLVANDFVQVYAHRIRKLAFNVAWADQAVLAIIAGLVFLLAPVMLRYIWHTRILPDGELRARLEGLCRRVGLKYRRILIWESDGMVVNAAVMGLFRPVRYILLSDGLLEMMDDDKIEAVFGHEAGHVKLRHIEYYLLFAVLSMLMVGGAVELVIRAPQSWQQVFSRIPDFKEYLQVAAMGLVALIWLVGFGAVSRQFEMQADLFGARSVTPGPDGCDRPCLVHRKDEPSAADDQTRGNPICASAGDLFSEALNRIALLNGIPVDARSWRHSSIANRMKRLHQYSTDPDAAPRLDGTVLLIKWFLLMGTTIGLVIAVYLYWPGSR